MIQIAQLLALILFILAFFAAMQPAQWLIGLAIALMISALIRQVEVSAKVLVETVKEGQAD